MEWCVWCGSLLGSRGAPGPGLNLWRRGVGDFDVNCYTRGSCLAGKAHDVHQTLVGLLSTYGLAYERCNNGCQHCNRLIRRGHDVVPKPI